MTNTHVKNIKLGACGVSFGGVDLGYTKGGVQVEVATETMKVTVDQLGQTTISELVQGRNITITAPLAESVLKNMVDLMPGSTLSEDGNSVTITSAQGVNLIDVAKELVLTPQDTSDYVLTIPKAATSGNFTMTYQSDDVRVFSVQFSAYPDDNGVLGTMTSGSSGNGGSGADSGEDGGDPDPEPDPVEVNATGVTVEPATAELSTNDVVQFKAVFEPSDTTDKTGIWSSSEPDLVMVDDDGQATAIDSVDQDTKVSITFVSNDGGFSDSAEITVKATEK